jgi:hypothetical protein
MLTVPRERTTVWSRWPSNPETSVRFVSAVVAEPAPAMFARVADPRFAPP